MKWLYLLMRMTDAAGLKLLIEGDTQTMRLTLYQTDPKNFEAQWGACMKSEGALESSVMDLINYLMNYHQVKLDVK